MLRRTLSTGSSPVIVDNYILKKEGVLVDKAWNGFTFCFVTVFKGVKNYLNEWFGLELK